MSLRLSATLKHSSRGRIVEATDDACREPPERSRVPPPSVMPGVCVEPSDGAGAAVVEVVAGVMAHPAAKPTSRIPCTISVVIRMPVSLPLL
jgi:hypothetical protein